MHDNNCNNKCRQHKNLLGGAKEPLQFTNATCTSAAPCSWDDFRQKGGGKPRHCSPHITSGGVQSFRSTERFTLSPMRDASPCARPTPLISSLTSLLLSFFVFLTISTTLTIIIVYPPGSPESSRGPPDPETRCSSERLLKPSPEFTPTPSLRCKIRALLDPAPGKYRARSRHPGPCRTGKETL